MPLSHLVESIPKCSFLSWQPPVKAALCVSSPSCERCSIPSCLLLGFFIPWVHQALTQWGRAGEKTWTCIPYPCRIQMPLVFHLEPGQLEQIHAAMPTFAECFSVRFVWLSKFSRNSLLAFFWIITNWRLCSSRFFHDLQPHPWAQFSHWNPSLPSGDRMTGVERAPMSCPRPS